MMETTTTKKALARYSAYKDSGVDWLGEIPVGWEVVRLKFGLAIKNGADYKHVVSDQGYPVIGSGGVFAYASQYLYDGEVVMLGRKGTIDTPLYFYGKFWAVDTMYYSIARNGNSARFLYFAATTIPFKLYSTATAMPSMTKGDLDDHPIALPPLPEQRAIATFLDEKTSKIDQAIRQKEKLIVLLKERKQILIQQAVTKGLDPHAKMKDSGVDWIGEIPEGWEVKRLKNFVQIQSGLTLGKNYQKKGLTRISYLRVANVQSGYFLLDQITEVEIPSNDIQRYLLQKGDILVTEGGDIDKLGRGTIWNQEINPCIHQNHIFAVRVISPDILAPFISIVFGADYGRHYFTHTANKTTNLASTNSTKLGDFPVALPNASEQLTIIHHIETQSTKIDASIALHEKQIEKLKEYKATLIDSVVTGKVKITGI